MNAGEILFAILGSIAVFVLVFVLLCNAAEKRKIRNNLVPGTKFIFYGNCGGGDPFREANIAFTIIQVKAGHVLYHFSSDAPKLMPSLMKRDDDRSCTIDEFVNRIYKTKNVTITPALTKFN